MLQGVFNEQSTPMPTHYDEIDALNLIFYRNAIRPGAIFFEADDIVAEPNGRDSGFISQ